MPVAKTLLTIFESIRGSSGYCTPTKYWLPLSLSIQKLRLIDTLEFMAATT